jgi:hypothetical protein
MVGWRPSGARQGATAAVVAGLTVLALAAAGCTIRTRPEPATTTTLPRGVAAATTTTITGPVTHGTTVASRAFTLVRGDGWDRLGPAASGPLPVAMPGTVESIDEAVGLVLVFALLRARPSCVRQMELWLRVLRLDHEPDLSAYPSSLVSLASARPATRVGSETLLDNRPRGTGTLTGDRDWLHFDVTGLYRTWAEGGPFPSLDRNVPRGTPLVVDVRASSNVLPLFEARVAPIGGDRSTAPQLRWTVARDC